MLIVALTGGIATGKSIVARVWDELGCYIQQADQVARGLMLPGTPVWEEIVARFGTGILGQDGRSIDRASLGRWIFAHPDDRRFLNSLIHPLVLEERNTLIARLRTEGEYRIFVSEAALTIEAGYAEHFHKVVVTHCPLEEQLGRLRERDGIDREEALLKIQSQMPAEEKDAAMERFQSGDAQVLVATTVIEVGVDVPEATVMVVLDADRFGVATLHQLRGRVGRGFRPSVCLLVTRAPNGSPARDRVEAVAATNDGFALADIDLEQRREGDLLGDAQSGRRSSLRLLSLRRDGPVISAARAAASAVVDDDPDLATHPALAADVDRVTRDRADYLQRA
jgi:dephospho-CoA kinase